VNSVVSGWWSRGGCCVGEQDTGLFGVNGLFAVKGEFGGSGMVGHAAVAALASRIRRW